MVASPLVGNGIGRARVVAHMALAMSTTKRSSCILIAGMTVQVSSTDLNTLYVLNQVLVENCAATFL